ncbi:fibronectin type III domain-containing protein [Streptomyces sp. R302]|uniref:fibronectin type III domain-containing protein n=1 Tax=unclassified Streptomyces TaxID=2593676 RepID=UPI00145F67CE|nr:MULTISPECIES: fibronectin type III domain-containing protein [unclassified Streptomyces]NML51302.1 fibronectin type III domain-containing protein [Streptomyces sp. R301]NML79880.1 fibronectin type III domain-containing protein [Streptomyces sp. R302]
MLVLGACARAEPPDSTPPTAPTGLTAASGSSTTVHVMWEAATDDRAVTGYQVLQDGRPVKDLPATTVMTDVTGLAPGSRHTYAVTARDAAGNTSPATPAVTATTLRATADDREPPTAPGTLHATPDGSTAAVLTWTPARDDTRVTAYDVHQAGVRIHTAPGTATTARLTGLRPGTAYSLTLRARDAAENSSPDSPPAELTTAPAPGAPPNTSPRALTATSADGEITLTWTPPETGAPVTHHELHIDGRFATTIAWGAAPPPGRATYTFPAQAKPGTTYTLTLRARLPDGTWGDFSAPHTVTVR